MKVLVRTNDQVLLSWLQAMLAAEGISSAILDSHTSILEGSAGAIPRRLVVGDEDYERARRLMDIAGEAQAAGPAGPKDS